MQTDHTMVKFTSHHISPFHPGYTPTTPPLIPAPVGARAVFVTLLTIQYLAIIIRNQHNNRTIQQQSYNISLLGSPDVYSCFCHPGHQCNSQFPFPGKILS